MPIYLHDKYAKNIQTIFTTQSLIAGRLSTEYSFSGVRTVNVSTPQTVPMTDYTRSGTNRYGTPTEMEDVVQELTLTQDKSFSLTIDKGNNADQNGIKAAGKMLGLQIAEQAIPSMDRYCFMQLAQKAGNVVGNSTKLSKTTVCDRISEGTLVLDDAEVPQDGRTLYVSNTTYKYLKHSDEFLGVDELGKSALAKGQVGMYDNMTVVKVPKGRWPANVNFIIVYKNSATAPVKLNDTKLHEDPPGISGNLLEGRQYYDLFVFGAKAAGVYVEVDTSSSAGTVLTAPSIAADTGVITPTDSATVKYTVDGTDPRYSKSAQIGTTVTADAGTIIKAYQYKEGAYPSPVAEVKKTA